MRNVVIAGAVRTPIGNLNGSLSSMSATALGSCVIRESLERAGVHVDAVDEVIMGNVLSAGLGQAPARQAAKGAGLGNSVTTTTVNKMCGSSLKAIMLACQAIGLGDADVIVAGGMESMSRAPYLLEKARTGYHMGHGQLIDSVIKDGLWDPYGNLSMGACAELCAAKYEFSREEQDDFAVQSYVRALSAQQEGRFRDEIVEVHLPSAEAPILVTEDERLKRYHESKLRQLRPAFQDGGTITAGNASGMNDGAAAMVLLSEERAASLDIRPMARVIGFTEEAVAPEWFTIAPIQAISKLLSKLRMDVDHIDLFEVNEAFAVVPLAASKELRLNPDRLNIHGGAVALGHPIGATGARILTTLLHALKQAGGRRGIASPCIGGGEAVAVAVEMMA